MGSSERSTSGGHWANIDSRSPPILNRPNCEGRSESGLRLFCFATFPFTRLESIGRHDWWRLRLPEEHCSATILKESLKGW